jgi:hypothetical protein
MEALTFKDFQSKVVEYPGYVILFFTATWDTIGINTRNFLDSLATDPAVIVPLKVFSVDYDGERELVEKFSVRNLPDIFGFHNGKLTGSAYHCSQY